MLPQYKEIEIPLLLEIWRRGGQVKRPKEDQADGRNIYESLAVHFKLKPPDLAARTKNGENRSKWENMVRWARKQLTKQGLLFSGPWGTWRLTDLGSQRIQQTGGGN